MYMYICVCACVCTKKMKRSYAFPGNRKSGFCSLPIHPQILPQLTNILSIFDDFSTRECQGVPLQKSRGCSFHKQKWALWISIISLYFLAVLARFPGLLQSSPSYCRWMIAAAFWLTTLNFTFFLPPGHVWGGATMMVQLHQHVVTVDLTLKCILQKAFLLFGLAPWTMQCL